MQKRHPMLVHGLSLIASGRPREGLAVLAKLASQDDPEALLALAEYHWCGGPLPQDFGRGRELIRRAARAGHKLAGTGWTNLLASGTAGARDWKEALRRLREEARTDSGRARALSVLEKMDLGESGDPRALPQPRKLSDSPWVSLFPAAFSREECDFLVATAEPAFRPSLVGDGAGGEVRRSVRTSDDMTIPWLMEDPATHALNRRLAALTGTRPEQAEALLILRYRPGQEYRPHVDWDGGENGRVMTALVYLNDDYAGGETLFVKTGLKVKGGIGDVLVFRSTTPDGEFDPMSEHAGLPVLSGTKYLASRWIHEHRFAP